MRLSSSDVGALVWLATAACLIADNPVRYLAAWVQMIVGCALFFAGVAVSKRFWA
jgi:hypothetical protein